MNLWERTRVKRRAEVIEAARDLIAEGGVEAISMRKLAASAEVSVATLYNQFGGKEDIVEMVLEQVLDAIDPVLGPIPQDEPFERARMIALTAIDTIVADAPLYQPFIRALTQTGRGRDRDASAAWMRGVALPSEEVSAAMATGHLRDDIAAELIGEQILRSFNSSMVAWAFGIVDDDDFRDETLRGLYVCLLAVATDESRPVLLEHLRMIEIDHADRVVTTLEPADDRETSGAA